MRLYKLSKVLPIYCSCCKRHMRGPDPGYNDPSVSHGLCPECFKIQLDKMNEEDNIKEDNVNNEKLV